MDAAPALVSQGHSSTVKPPLPTHTQCGSGGALGCHLQEALYPRAFLRDQNGHGAPAERDSSRRPLLAFQLKGNLAYMFEHMR